MIFLACITAKSSEIAIGTFLQFEFITFCDATRTTFRHILVWILSLSTNNNITVSPLTAHPRCSLPRRSLCCQPQHIPYPLCIVWYYDRAPHRVRLEMRLRWWNKNHLSRWRKVFPCFNYYFDLKSVMLRHTDIQPKYYRYVHRCICTSFAYRSTSVYSWVPCAVFCRSRGPGRVPT